MSYQAPLEDVQHILTHITDIDQFISDGLAEALDSELVSAILDEAGKFAADQLAPLNQVGDQQGCSLKNGNLTTPNGWQEAYTQWKDAGWAALSAPEEFGGQNLPHLLSQAVSEFWNSSNLAFGLCPLLTQGAVDAIADHANDELKQTYLEKMVSGEWTGTMNLTEAQAGSDLSAVRTKATPNGDGTYAIKGTKIFITYGEHNLTENIIHLVLARLPDAPEGTKGISLFLVPKFILDENGNPGKRNDLICSGIEHKLGIHASPTCTMSFGDNEGATGYLVGEENRGLHAMFTMMNLARLSVGTQGVAIMERSAQAAINYADDRTQGAALGSPRGTSDPIIKHPDVRRNISLMKAMTMASRAICLMTAKYIDISIRAVNEEEKKAAAEKAALLTPIAKAFSTDCAVEATSIGVQVHGGMGYVEETGAAQHMRDARILPIYEGTNGIQALDLLFRKISLDGGKTLKSFMKEMSEIQQASNETTELQNQLGSYLSSALNDLTETVQFLETEFKAEGNNNPSTLYYAATPLLRLLGLCLGGSYLIKGALNAEKANEPQAEKQKALASIFAHQFLTQTSGLKQQIIKGAASLETETNKIFGT